MTSRRKFMMILGGGVLVAAGGGATWAMTRDPDAARKPWETAQALTPSVESDPRRYALSHAILAPNPHNRQPWIADLSVKDEVTLYCQADRRLPHTDPFDRQITIGLGCFSELLIMAAASIGFRVEANLFPQGEALPRLDDRPVARFRFIADQNITADPLFEQIFDRRSNKEAYDPARQVTAANSGKILAAVKHVSSGSTVDADKVQELRELAWNAMDIEMRTYRTAKESIDLLRIGKAEIEANPDGIDLPGPLFEALDTFGMMSREDMLDTSSTIFRQQMDAMREPFDTAMGFVWLKTPGNSRVDQIAAGRDYARINLAATAIGISMQPFSQALQEYEEMTELFGQMRERLGIGQSETLQMFSRIGYGQAQKPAPRWPLETRIRSA